MESTMRAFLFFLLFSATASAQSYDQANFHADGRKWQPVPSGHAPGKDNGRGFGLHNAGEDCGICHTPGGKAANYVFTISGTIYSDRGARRPIRGAEVILQDSAGNVLSMTTNEVGNFWSYAPIASHPTTVASHGGVTHELFGHDDAGTVIPADPTDSRTWLYKAWIRHGDNVRPMVSIVPVGGANGTTPRMSCNMHHSPMGSSGSLWVTPSPTLTGYPESGLSFHQHVQPILVSKCAPCHVPGRRSTRLVTATDVDPTAPTSIDYSAGKDFTSWAGSSYPSDGGVTLKAGPKDLVDPAAPDESALLKKVRFEAGAQHGGGAFWTLTDEDYRVLRQWIAEGAQDN